MRPEKLRQGGAESLVCLLQESEAGECRELSCFLKESEAGALWYLSEVTKPAPWRLCSTDVAK